MFKADKGDLVMFEHKLRSGALLAFAAKVLEVRSSGGLRDYRIVPVFGYGSSATWVRKVTGMPRAIRVRVEQALQREAGAIPLPLTPWSGGGSMKDPDSREGGTE